MQMKVTLKMMMPIVAPSWDYIRMANMTASAAPGPEAKVTSLAVTCTDLHRFAQTCAEM